MKDPNKSIDGLRIRADFYNSLLSFGIYSSTDKTYDGMGDKDSEIVKEN